MRLLLVILIVDSGCCYYVILISEGNYQCTLFTALHIGNTYTLCIFACSCRSNNSSFGSISVVVFYFYFSSTAWIACSQFDTVNLHISTCYSNFFTIEYQCQTCSLISSACQRCDIVVSSYCGNTLSSTCFVVNDFSIFKDTLDGYGKVCVFLDFCQKMARLSQTVWPFFHCRTRRRSFYL